MSLLECIKLINEEIIFPNRVLIEKDEYPENIVLLGELSKHLPFKEETWLNVIEKKVPAKTIDVNFAAFKAGRKAQNITYYNFFIHIMNYKKCFTIV